MLVFSVLAASASLPACEERAAPARADDAVDATQVTFFVPEIPSGEERAGRCWTGSIAAPRAGAWRCMVGNDIHDPCFSAPPRQDVVVCGADPVTGDRGFTLKLTEPLPASEPLPSADPSPWLIELADRSLCSPFTGTMPAIDGEPARYSCTAPQGGAGDTKLAGALLLDVTPGKVWTATRFLESAADPMRRGRRVTGEKVQIRRLWD
jgi:hypothetical protein